MALARADRLKLGDKGVYPPFSMVDPTGRLTNVEPDLARASAVLSSMLADRAPTKIRRQRVALSPQSADAACAGKQA